MVPDWTVPEWFLVLCLVWAAAAVGVLLGALCSNSARLDREAEILLLKERRRVLREERQLIGATSVSTASDLGRRPSTDTGEIPRQRSRPPTRPPTHGRL